MVTMGLAAAEDISEALNFRGIDQERLFSLARECRGRFFSNKVEVRSVVEYSNICRQECGFCGMARSSDVRRYLMSDDQFLEIVDGLYEDGRRVVMIQTGEHEGARYLDGLAALLERVKRKYPDLTLVASFGSLSDKNYERLRQIGVDRYLLKFETSDGALYSRIKPTDDLRRRLDRIDCLKRLGFKVSSGNISGIPGQNLASLVSDLLLLRELRIPMVSTSPFIPHDMTAFADQPSANLDTTLNFMAILRILCPDALIPTTSALELLGHGSQALGLAAGANAVTLHDGTPRVEADDFVIYRKDRHQPTLDLLNAVEKAGLECLNEPLI